MLQANLSALFKEFLVAYDAPAMDALWKDHSGRFRAFLKNRVLSDGIDVIPDEVCDEVIRILDRNGKGNTKDSEAVAKAMVPQGAWRRMFNEFHHNKPLGSLVVRMLGASATEKVALVNELYEMNAGQKNNLTGPSGNTVGALLAAYDPVNNVSIISLKDRRFVMDFMGIAVPLDWDKATMGERIVLSNAAIIEGFKSAGFEGSARTISRFCYYPPMKALWKGEHLVKLADKSVSVTIPAVSDVDNTEQESQESIRESTQIQAMLARIGASMGFSIWLPKADRSRVLKAWQPAPGQLVDDLPLGYDAGTIKTVEQIDVIWLKKRSIARAFEVEHTAAVYSGLLRMADLMALQPNINIKMHIVAPAEKREKVFQEIRRPVFSFFLEDRALSEMCTFLSYDSVKELAELKHIEHLRDEVLATYEEYAE